MTLPDRDSLSTYGGAMSDYSAPVDPTTDESATYRNKYAANVAMMTHTITRGARSFLGSTGGVTQIADPSTGFVHDNLWGDSAAVKATASYVQTGTYSLTVPTAVTDELGVSHPITLRRAWAAVESTDGVLKLATAKVSASQRITVYTYERTATGLVSGSNLVGEVITVFFI